MLFPPDMSSPASDAMISSAGPVDIPIIASAPTLAVRERCGSGNGAVTGIETDWLAKRELSASGCCGCCVTIGEPFVESPVGFLNALKRSASLSLLSPECPIIQVRLSCAASPRLCSLLMRVDSRSGNTGISSHIVARRSPSSSLRARARYSHARCWSSASRTCVYRSKMLIRWSLISGNRLTHCREVRNKYNVSSDSTHLDVRGQ